jgi:hypothetical protein
VIQEKKPLEKTAEKKKEIPKQQMTMKMIIEAQSLINSLKLA